ncbi:MAG TPA: 3-isopropylmalate dehydratase small subunit, partial [Acidobacteria bacterium]|nr:3-isopropylmalate dehydratase small subunit [Acidobacteriota bacterium]
ALLDQGFRAVLAPRFADIFRNNAAKNGLLTVELDRDTWQEMVQRLEAQPDAPVSIDLERERLGFAGGPEVSFSLDPFARHCLLTGLDPLAYLLAQEAQLDAYEAA